MRSASHARSLSGRSAKMELVFSPRTMLSICAALAGVLMSDGPQVLMNELNRVGALADAGGDTFDGTVANVAGYEDAGNAGFEEPGLAVERPALGHFAVNHEVGTGEDKSFIVASELAGEPISSRRSANKNEERSGGNLLGFAAGGAKDRDSFKKLGAERFSG